MNTINRILIKLDQAPILLNGSDWVMSALDVLIVAYLLYRIIKWIKETRAWSLFKGLIVIVFIFLLSNLIHLFTIQWIIKSTLSVGVTAVIIVFQPEMRKALEQLGKGKIVSLFNTSGVIEGGELGEGSVTELVQAVMIMAKVKTGALIVIQKQVGLADQEATGIPLDAVITKQLIINIFEDKTPLHDGALIIKDNRLAAATCIMPLTASEIGAELGTRHRAAVGVSEISDATVIVVSEETGVVSIAKEGKLYRNMSEKDLTGMLSENKKPTRLKRVLWKGKGL